MMARIRICVASFAAFAAVSILCGCELAYKKQVESFINENIQECNGKLKKLALVQDGSNRLTGLAEIDVDGEEYKTTVTVKTGIKDAIITMEDNVCAMHSVRSGVKALQNLFN
jgi:hypothetical protein